MPLLPDSRAERITFYETHLPPWTEHAARLGLSAAQTAELAGRAAAARASCAAPKEALAAAPRLQTV